MDKKDRKTSKLAIAGLVVSVAIPSCFFLCVLVFESFYKQLNGALEIFMLLLLILPFIALPLSIAGMVIAKKKDNGIDQQQFQLLEEKDRKILKI